MCISVPGPNELSLPNLPDYASLQKRLDSFKLWPSNAKLNGATLFSDCTIENEVKISQHRRIKSSRIFSRKRPKRGMRWIIKPSIHQFMI